MRALSWLTLVFLAACGAAPPAGPTPAAPPPGPRVAPASAPAPAPAGGCSVVRGLSARCGPCVAAQCCAPPVAFDRALLLNLGCHIGCRKPSGARDRLPPDQYVEALARCLALCDGTFPDPSGQAGPLDACVAELCLGECLRD
ncbi:MAG TPA: hypothetical protein VGQ83_11735 [Polyangia bacterium]